jgi:hypothetical protein
VEDDRKPAKSNGGVATATPPAPPEATAAPAPALPAAPTATATAPATTPRPGWTATAAADAGTDDPLGDEGMSIAALTAIAKDYSRRHRHASRK